MSNVNVGAGLASVRFVKRKTAAATPVPSFFCFTFFSFVFCGSKSKRTRTPKNKTAKPNSLAVCFLSLLYCYYFYFPVSASPTPPLTERILNSVRRLRRCSASSQFAPSTQSLTNSDSPYPRATKRDGGIPLRTR